MIVTARNLSRGCIRNSVSVCLFVCLLVCLSVRPSRFCLSGGKSLFQNIGFHSLQPAIYREDVLETACLSVCLSVCLFVCLSVCLPVCLSVSHAFVCLEEKAYFGTFYPLKIPFKHGRGISGTIPTHSPCWSMLSVRHRGRTDTDRLFVCPEEKAYFGTFYPLKITFNDLCGPRAV